MAHGGRGIGRGILCAHREGKEVVMGDNVGRGRILLVDTAADRREHVAVARFSRLLCFDGYAHVDEGGVFWSHVGRGQYQLRIDDAAFGDLAGGGRGHRRGAGCRHAGAIDHAWAGRSVVRKREWAADDGRIVAGADRRGVCLLCRASERDSTERRTEGVQFEAGGALAILCGIFSSGMAFAMDAALPMKDAALHLGVNPLYAALPSYVFIMGGGAVVNMSYCFIRLAALKRISLRDDLSQPGGTLLRNGLLAAAGGIMWYLQFFFYAWGQANIPERLAYVNWMLHMSGYVLFAGIIGLALGEWAGVGSRPLRLLWAGMLIIIAAANLVGLGMAS